jgi:peptide-methionine (S)-S-oxide reductase
MKKSKEIVLGGGCFWCIEAIFQKVKGIINITPGYAGGILKDPTYEAVCTGNTGHAEVVKVEFDTENISLKEILDVFFLAHDPTTENRQGSDIGTQYRSIILYTDKSQLDVIKKVVDRQQKNFKKDIVTQVKALDVFYEAEQYHKNYYINNSDSRYCRFVIKKKLEKFLKENHP